MYNKILNEKPPMHERLILDAVPQLSISEVTCVNESISHIKEHSKVVLRLTSSYSATKDGSEHYSCSSCPWSEPGLLQSFCSRSRLSAASLPYFCHYREARRAALGSFALLPSHPFENWGTLAFRPRYQTRDCIHPRSQRSLPAEFMAALRSHGRKEFA